MQKLRLRRSSPTKGHLSSIELQSSDLRPQPQELAVGSTAEPKAREMEKLRLVLELKKKLQVLRNYMPEHIRAEVAKFGVRRVSKCLLEGEEEYNHSLRDLELSVNRDVFMDYWLSGSHLVRGFDKQGRPLVWINEALYPKWPSKTIYILLYLWTVRLALRSRPEGVTHVHAIFFERDRKPLAFNVDHSTRMMALGTTM
mmetsp:Transcript_14243/g.35302  ORF Transcript_14243/g.35302 Transcript_14243/m.35302 type:complete len:199 (+) Transcript_14243:258-854(+)